MKVNPLRKSIILGAFALLVAGNLTACSAKQVQTFADAMAEGLEDMERQHHRNSQDGRVVRTETILPGQR